MGGELNLKTTIRDSREIFEILKDDVQLKTTLAIWQEEDGSVKGQPFCYGKIIKLNDRELEIKLDFIKKVRIDNKKKIFVFGPKKNILFEVDILKLGSNLLVLPIPDEINIVADNFLEEKKVISKEDEEKYLSQRGEPRKKTSGYNSTQFKKLGPYQKKSKKFKLYDLSPNGMSFIVYNPEQFEVEEELEILFINQQAFDPPLVGEIRSIREMEDGEFKIGVLFKQRGLKKSA